MNYLSSSSIQSFSVRAGALLRRGLLFSGEPTARLGGLGDEVNQEFYRRVVPPAMLASPSFSHFFSCFVFSVFPPSSASPSYFSVHSSAFSAAPILGFTMHHDVGLVCGVSWNEPSHGFTTDCDALSGPEEQWAKPKRCSGLGKAAYPNCSVTTQSKGVLMIHSVSEAMHPGRRPWVRAVLSLAAAAALPSLVACSSTCHRHETAGRVLDEQSVMLGKLKVERADTRVSTKVQADPDLKAAEEHLNMVIDMVTRSSSAVKSAL